MSASCKTDKMTLWFASIATIGCLILPTLSMGQAHLEATLAGQNNVTMKSTMKSNITSAPARQARHVHLFESAQNTATPVKMLMGDSVGLESALDSYRDLMPAAGEHKKYILVKKKPKHKKIKMEIYKPKMKYKKIKMKVPVKKMKKKKVKGYLVKKEKHGYH